MPNMSKKRNIKRNPYSIEDGIKDIIEKIGDKGLREANKRFSKNYPD